MLKRRTDNTQSGFTLIELLVVIGIIALLASVIMSSFAEARRKSRNASRVQDVLAYSKAVESYQVTKLNYPNGGLDWSTGTLNICLGRTSCFAGGYAGSTALDTQFKTEIATLRSGIDSGLSLVGYAYACLGVLSSTGACNEYRILYQLEGTDASVVNGTGANAICAGGGLQVQKGTGLNPTQTECEIIQCSGGRKPTPTNVPGNSVWICQ